MKHRRQNKFPHLDEKPKNGLRYYWFDGSPMTLGEWVTMTECRTQAVGSAVIRGKGRTYWVSTVLLGIDYSFGASEKPVIFETAVFERPGGLLDILGRYRTHREARKGHRLIRTQMRQELAAKKSLLHNGRKP